VLATGARLLRLCECGEIEACSASALAFPPPTSASELAFAKTDRQIRLASGPFCPFAGGAAFLCLASAGAAGFALRPLKRSIVAVFVLFEPLILGLQRLLLSIVS
jgi:hypothetical protein